jgi:perosamine synthetase
LRLETLAIDRNAFIRELSQAGVSCSVHWRPLHLHPYYEETFGWSPSDLPVASTAWTRLVSLPLFSTMSRHEIDAVVDKVRAACGRSSRLTVTR